MHGEADIKHLARKDDSHTSLKLKVNTQMDKETKARYALSVPLTNPWHQSFAPLSSTLPSAGSTTERVTGSAAGARPRPLRPPAGGRGARRSGARRQWRRRRRAAGGMHELDLPVCLWRRPVAVGGWRGTAGPTLTQLKRWRSIRAQTKKQTPSDMKCWDLCLSEASEAVGMLAQRPAAPTCFLFFVLAYLYVHDTSDIQGK
jgi:hypothetical protein